MLEMGKRFFDASGYAEITEYDPDTFLATLRAASGSVILVVEKEGVIVGMALALIFPLYFNAKHTFAQEVLWWIDPEHRGIGSKLFDALVAESKARGAQSMSVTATETLEPERVGGFYMKRGFRLADHSYIKKL